MSIREAAAVGRFYPPEANQIEAMIARYNRLIDERFGDDAVLRLKPKAVIVPHAGYVYSAFTANIAMRLLANSGAKSVVIIGPSHRVYFKGVSIGAFEAYETPYGQLAVDLDLVGDLRRRFNLRFYPQAHREHSTEVEVPLVRHYLPDAKIVEIVYGEEDPIHLAQIVSYLLGLESVATVISTDLSHYYTLKKAKALDGICIEAIANLDEAMLHQGCEACGKTGVEAMIRASKRHALKPIILDYRTSADASGDDSEVVGYLSVAFVKDEDAK